MKKFCNKNTLIKGVIGVLLIIIIIELINIIFSENIKELKNEYIDKYNFEQLEKVKNILDKLDKNSYNFGNLNQFNEKFSQNIKSKKDCYFIVDRNRFYIDNNGGGGYIFGFKLESNKYIQKYGTGYYVYPKYDLPENKICFGLGHSGGKCQDKIRESFENTISNPCQD